MAKLISDLLTEIAFRILVSISDSGSVFILSFYQLLLATPWDFPFEACSLNERRDNPKRRIYPRALPVSRHLFLLRLGLLLGGNRAKPSRSPAAFSSARFLAYLTIIRLRFHLLLALIFWP